MTSMRKHVIVGRVLALAVLALAIARVDAARGTRLAQRWCASCHIIGETPPSQVQVGPPSSPSIAESKLTPEQLRVFLTKPHGSMPDLSLTRAEIDDLVAYIESLK